MRAGFSFSYPPISLLLGQPLSIKKSYAGAIQNPNGFAVQFLFWEYINRNLKVTLSFRYKFIFTTLAVDSKLFLDA
jgi:hypothetical protein